MGTIWNDIGWGGILTIVTILGVIVGGFKWIANKIEESKNDEAARNNEAKMVHVAIFGWKAEPPLPAIPGLLEEQKTQNEQLNSLLGAVVELRQDVKKILAQSQPNGGDSMYDKVSAIQESMEKDPANAS